MQERSQPVEGRLNFRDIIICIRNSCEPGYEHSFSPVVLLEWYLDLVLSALPHYCACHLCFETRPAQSCRRGSELCRHLGAPSNADSNSKGRNLNKLLIKLRYIKLTSHKTKVSKINTNSQNSC